MSIIKDNALVLFQGDSITDCGRDRSVSDDLGRGYPLQVAGRFSALYPEKNVRFLNRGISGNRVRNLEERWQEDCIDLKPDVVSILIGINDTWRRYDRNDPTSVEQYEEGYRRILTRVREELDAQIIMIEPFLLQVYPAQDDWREDLDPKIQAARRLAREFAVTYIPMDGLFAQASVKREPAFWAADGVHPTMPGHSLITEAWLEAVKAK